MRPINKGDIPSNEDGSPKSFSNHRSWRKDLVDRIGNYCCYCGMELKNSPQVEHVIAQNIDSTLSLDWYNLLLACGACNRAKSDNSCPPHTHYLPDTHNTYLAFDLYLTINPRQSGEEAAFIITNSNLTANQAAKANNTIKLCRLHEDTTYDPDKVTDLRWRFRFQAFQNAELWRKNWNDWGNSKADKFIPLLMTAALPTGFFSVWFRVFEDVPTVKKALIEGFIGTALNCFDENNNYDPIWRNPPNDI